MNRVPASKGFLFTAGGLLGLLALVEPLFKSKKRYQKLLEEHAAELSLLQQLHYASTRYALSLIFQGIDAAEKDGAIRHVISGVKPRNDSLSGINLWRDQRRCHSTLDYQSPLAFGVRFMQSKQP